MRAFRVPEPMRLSDWAEQHFYLSAESSYVEGRWKCYPFQTAIMDCMGHDDIRAVWFMKSARVGYTKMILACMAYMAAHKQRNQAIWQPVDDDADEFCKTEIDTMIRDCKAVRDIFPYYNTKNKNNTLRQKGFIGSTLHIRGGKAAKNYRRLSVDTVYLDEVDGFDDDIEKEGDPVSLVTKRTEGAVFPKFIGGSTPKLKGFSATEAGFEESHAKFYYHIPCPECGHSHKLAWSGFVFDKTDTRTVRYQCPDCGHRYTQQDYLAVWHAGKWIDPEIGIYIDVECRFRSVIDDSICPVPESVGFFVWTAYSPQTTWQRIVDDFLRAKKDPSKLKSFVNTTLGETWEEQGTQPPVNSIIDRREEYLADVPQGGLVLTAGLDVQGDRIEMYVIAWGEHEESWYVDVLQLYGSPSEGEVWQQVDQALSASYSHESGARLGISAACIDSGGHHTQFVYDFCRTRVQRRIVPIKGIAGEGKPIIGRVNRQSTGKNVKRKVDLYPVGVDSAKALIYSRLQITEHGPGYVHVPSNHSLFADEFAEQLTAERLITKYQKGFASKEWQKTRPRNEALDCTVYAVAALRLLNPNFLSLKENVINSASNAESNALTIPKPRIARRKGAYL